MIGQVSTLQTDVSDLIAADIAIDGRLDTAESNITTLQGQMSTAISDISTLQSEMITANGNISTLQTEMDIVQEQNSVYEGIVYNSFASVYADGQPGILDPKSITNPRAGWYFQNYTAGEKINWYFFDGQTQATVELQNYSAYAIMTFDAVETPIMAVYTFPTGSGDIIPGFAHSRVVYSAPMSIVPVVGKQYLVYFGQNPAAHPEILRIQLTYSAASGGPQGPTEIVSTSSFGSDSSAGVNSVQFMVETLGVNTPNYRAEADLMIRPAFREIDGSVNMLSAKISNLANPTLAQDASTKAYVDSKIAAGIDFEVQKVVLSATDITNQYVDLAFKASPASIISSSDRVNLIITLSSDSDADFIQDNSGAVTRLTFQGDSATGGGSPLSAGQIVYFNFVKSL